MTGFGLDVCGICDSDKESDWATVLLNAGMIAKADRPSMHGAGFFVCDRDLEDELVRAYGAANVVALIQEEGEGAAFVRFTGQPVHKAKSLDEQLMAFIQKGRKVRYAPLIVERLELSKIPPSLEQVTSYV